MKLIIIIQSIIAIAFLYQLSIYFTGILRRKEKITTAPNKRFALVIPAHNEEKVIGCLVENLQKLNYPRELYDIFAIVDNCNDNTESEVRKAGGIPWVRVNKERGKQWALGWAFDRLLKMNEYDAVCVFDADNLVSLDFLLIMNDKLLSGEKVIQGYLDTKNPDDTWVTRSYAIGYWTLNRLSQLARHNIGLPVYLGGTGFCVSMDIIKKYGWHVTTLVDDMEYSIQVLINGIVPTLAYDAKVWDEKPLTLKASMRQRLRWMQGQADVCFKYSLKLLWLGISKFKWRYIDALLYIWQPIMMFLNQLFLIGYTVNSIIAGTFYLLSFLQIFTFQILIMAVPMVIQKIPLRHYVGLLYQPIFGFTWMPLIAWGALTRGNKNWAHTVHVRNIKR